MCMTACVRNNEIVNKFTTVNLHNSFVCVQHNTTQHNTTQHNTTQHNTTQHNTTQHNTTYKLEKNNFKTNIPLSFFVEKGRGIFVSCRGVLNTPSFTKLPTGRIQYAPTFQKN